MRNPASSDSAAPTYIRMTAVRTVDGGVGAPTGAWPYPGAPAGGAEPYAGAAP